jgi:hypothetical protein
MDVKLTTKGEKKFTVEIQQIIDALAWTAGAWIIIIGALFTVMNITTNDGAMVVIANGILFAGIFMTLSAHLIHRLQIKMSLPFSLFSLVLYIISFASLLYVFLDRKTAMGPGMLSLFVMPMIIAIVMIFFNIMFLNREVATFQIQSKSKLDLLEEKVLNGTISEQLYHELKKKYETEEQTK